MAGLALGVVAWGEERYDLVVATTMGPTTFSLKRTSWQRSSTGTDGILHLQQLHDREPAVVLIGAAVVLTFLVP